MYIEQFPHHRPPTRVSVFVDGDNIASRHAQAIRDIAEQEGAPDFLRIYGNDNADPGWRQAPGMRMVNTGCGKNSADMLLTVQAMDRAANNGFETIILATSDGDFRHLAMYLKERGHRVIGVGYNKSPEVFQAACTVFREIEAPKPAPRVLEPLDQKIHEVIEREGVCNTGMLFAIFGGIMNRDHNVKLSNINEASWRGYVQKYPDLYDLDEKGPDARVRIKCRNVAKLKTAIMA